MKYNTLHKRVRTLYGKPSLCELCNSTEAKVYDWANVSGKYDTTDRLDWKRLCRKCHIDFDKSSDVKNRVVLMVWPNGSWIKFASITLATASTGISNTSISNVIHGRAKTAGNYRWRLAEVQ